MHYIGFPMSFGRCLVIAFVLLALVLRYNNVDLSFLSPWLQILVFALVASVGLMRIVRSPKSWFSYFIFLYALFMAVGVVFMLTLFLRL